MHRYGYIVRSAALATGSDLVIDDDSLMDPVNDPFEVELENDLMGNTETAQAENNGLTETIVNQLIVTNLLLALILGCICTSIFCRYIRG